MRTKFENKNQDVATMSIFAKRVFRFSMFAFVLIVFSVGMGTVGYWYFDAISWLDSFYMASMILTGMGPVSEMTNDGAKWFSAFYALYSGVAFLSITAVFFAPMIHRILHILHVEEDKSEEE